MRNLPSELNKLIAGLHQDFDVEVEQAGSFEAAVSRMPDSHLSEGERERLRPLLHDLASQAEASELKALLRRDAPDYFFTSAQAKSIFQIWSQSLETMK